VSDMTELPQRLRALARHEHDDLSIGDEAADEIERLQAELATWRKLADPQTLHANLLRGLPARLTREQVLHLAGADDLLAAERERCAAICDTIEDRAWDLWRAFADPTDQGRSIGADACAQAIRRLE